MRLEAGKTNHIVVVIEHTIAGELAGIGIAVISSEAFGKLDNS
jgi:hypothetical protein